LIDFTEYHDTREFGIWIPRNSRMEDIDPYATQLRYHVQERAFDVLMEPSLPPALVGTSL
jgi:hypothetical protein